MYDLDLQSQASQGQGQPSGQKSRSNRRVPTDKRTDTHTDATKHIIAPATRFIKIAKAICAHWKRVVLALFVLYA